MSKKYGLAIGKFAPFHVGHMYYLTECLKKCDELFIILSFDQRFIDKQPKCIQPHLSLKSRFDALRNFVITYLLDYNKPVYFDIVDESNIPEYPNGWEPFVELVDQKISEIYYDPNIIFSSEESYKDDYKKYFPKCEHIIIDKNRNLFKISGTKLRRVMHMITSLSEFVDIFTSIEYFLEEYPDGRPS